MQQKYEVCPNCQSKISSSIFSENIIVLESYTRLINRFTEYWALAHCQKCQPDLLEKARSNYFNTLDDLKEKLNAKTFKLRKITQFVPIVTLQVPQDWKYKSLEIVSAQTVSGTGVISEIASNWTDFFGKDSKFYSEKIKGGEEKCKNILRAQTIKLGGNAILGTDIDYSEAGGSKGMLMVCMAGTAVKITNLDELDYNSEALNEIDEIMKVVEELEIQIEELTQFVEKNGNSFTRN